MQGDAIYAEIPPDAIPVLKSQLKENIIIFIWKFIVERVKPRYKVVQHPYMMALNRRTCIAKSNAQDLEFPKYTFSLTPIEMLPKFVRNNECFLGIWILF
jgi:replication factor A1